MHLKFGLFVLFLLLTCAADFGSLKNANNIKKPSMVGKELAVISLWKKFVLNVYL